MRCFIAIPCPEDIRQKLAEAGTQLGSYCTAKTVEADNIHMTLKFLGEVAEEKTAEIADRLMFLNGEGHFSLTVKGLGVFPNAGRINVVWAGVDGVENVAGLQGRVDERLVLAGFAREERFHPHYTIARVKYVSDRKRLLDFIAGWENREFGSYTVGSVRLMASELRQQGPVYSTVREYGLS